MDISIVVSIKSNYNSWKKLFDSDSGNRERIADESRTIVGKVSDKKAIVLMFNVDVKALGGMVEDPEFQKKIEHDVEHHEICQLTSFPDAIEKMRLAS